MCAIAKKIDSLIEPLRSLASCIGSPLFDVLARVYVGWVFLNSGLSRVESAMNGSWSDQVFLFSEEHPVPGLSGEAAAFLTTGAELVLPVLLIAGLFGRFAAAGMLVMTAVIEFTYLHATDHILWAFLLGMILFKGPGKLSVDYFLLKWLRK